MKNILITGGAGFIGSNFVRYLLETDQHLNVVTLDSLTYAGSLENLRNLAPGANHRFIRGDICDFELVLKTLLENKIDTVVHFAAESHVDRSIVGPAAFVQTNITGTFTLLEAARTIWDKTKKQGEFRFHHVSTDEVFGSLAPDDPAFTETTAYDPRSPYSASKAASDHLVRSYFHTYELPVTISNCSNNYGPYQFPEKLIPLMILNALQHKPLPVYGDGKQVRDWLYVEDHCEAIYLVLKNGRLGETYNIGGGNQPYNIQIVQSVCSLLDELVPASEPHASLIKHVPDRPGHDRRYAMDITKIKNDLGWLPKYDLQSGLRKTIRWYLDNQDWVESVQAQDHYSDWMEKNYLKRQETK